MLYDEENIWQPVFCAVVTKLFEIVVNAVMSVKHLLGFCWLKMVILRGLLHIQG